MLLLSSTMCIDDLLDKIEKEGEDSLTPEQRNQFNILSILSGEERKYFTQLISSNERDGLTGIYNRRKFDQDLEIEISRTNRTGRDVSLFMIDIDHFKKCNDTYGHQEGDRILREVAQCLVRTLRPYDAGNVYRYGGEEFTVLLLDTTNEGGIQTVERLRRNIEEECGVTVSIGVSNYKGICENGEDLVRSADNALYEAKDRGRNQAVLSKPQNS